MRRSAAVGGRSRASSLVARTAPLLLLGPCRSRGQRDAAVEVRHMLQRRLRSALSRRWRVELHRRKHRVAERHGAVRHLLRWDPLQCIKQISNNVMQSEIMGIYPLISWKKN